MENDVAYQVDWDAGPAAELDVFLPNANAGQTLCTKYTPPFRGTYRAPVRDLGIRTEDLEIRVRAELTHLTELRDEAIACRDAPWADVGLGHPRSNEISKQMRALGGQLFRSLFLHGDEIAIARQKSIFFSLSLDESLVQYPWELMHDGSEFLCLKHRMGRFVNNSDSNPQLMDNVAWWDDLLKEPSVLVIGADSPMQGLPSLPNARREAEAIVEKLQNLGLGRGLRTLLGNDATRDNVVAALKDNHYQIIHFCGHAHFDAGKPGRSSLVLHDQVLDTNLIAASFRATRPFLCFINACESARPGSLTDTFNIYDIGRALLGAGAYLVGSRWKLGDEVAIEFALTFYDSLVGQGRPIGEAVRLARVECKKAFPEDYGWASYVFYGDPRVRLYRVPVPARHRVSDTQDRELPFDEAPARPLKKADLTPRSTGVYDNSHASKSLGEERQTEAPVDGGPGDQETFPVRCTLLSYHGDLAHCQASSSGAVLPVKLPAEVLRAHGLEAGSGFLWSSRHGGAVSYEDISRYAIGDSQLTEDEAARFEALIEEEEKLSAEALREYFGQGRP
jgi:hypothetical protein